MDHLARFQVDFFFELRRSIVHLKIKQFRPSNVLFLSGVCYSPPEQGNCGTDGCEPNSLASLSGFRRDFRFVFRHDSRAVFE